MKVEGQCQGHSKVKHSSELLQRMDVYPHRRSGVDVSSSYYYLGRRLASGEGIVSLGVRLSRCVVCVSAAKVMRCMQCCLVFLCVRHYIETIEPYIGAMLAE